MSSHNKDSVRNILIVALSLCIVCSIVVSGAAVALKPVQEKNKERDMKKNILMAAGMYDPSISLETAFDTIEAKVIDLSTGEYTDIDPSSFNQWKEAKDPARSTILEEDPAGIGSRENHSIVYEVMDTSGGLDKVILPIRGYGLWSTLYGFIALEKDGVTVTGLGFYQHGETPGLGGEVDNPKWKALWPGKKILDKDGELAITVIKGKVNTDKADAVHKIDGLSGATITTNGINNFVRYWLGEDGFGPYLSRIRS